MITFNGFQVSTKDDYLEDVDAQTRKLISSESIIDTFLCDIGMFGKGELNLERRGGYTDAVLARGLLNYAQAMHHRLITVRGTLPEDITIGIPWYDFLGKPYKDKSFLFSQLADIISSEMYRDNRTQSVDSINFDLQDPNTLYIYITITPISAPAIDISFSVSRL